MQKQGDGWQCAKCGGTEFEPTEEEAFVRCTNCAFVFSRRELDEMADRLDRG